MPIRRVREYADLVRRGDETHQARMALLEAHARLSAPSSRRPRATSTSSSATSTAKGSPNDEPATARITDRLDPRPRLHIQTEYSLWFREPEGEILPTCLELGIGFVAYSPLGRGFLSGRFRSPEDLDAGDFRRSGPRFTGDNLRANLRIVEKVEEIAADKGVTSGQLALAWVLAQGDDVVPIPGTKRRAYFEENVAAAEVELTDHDLELIDAELPESAGDRYDAVGMSTVNR